MTLQSSAETSRTARRRWLAWSGLGVEVLHLDSTRPKYLDIPHLHFRKCLTWTLVGRVGTWSRRMIIARDCTLDVFFFILVQFQNCLWEDFLRLFDVSASSKAFFTSSNTEVWFNRIFPDFKIFCDQNFCNFIDFQPDFVCFSSILRYFSGHFLKS